ncbi:MAG: hypothetical protein VKP72_08745 [bacterium]|nr:hypothetical protein [bacterium]
MNDPLSIIVRSADQTRKAAVTLPPDLTVQQFLRAVQQRWNLPVDSDYAVRLDRTGEQLDPQAFLTGAGVRENDILDIYPILEAGRA